MKIACMMHNFDKLPLAEVCKTIANQGYTAVEACALKGGYPYIDLNAQPEPQMRVIRDVGLACTGLSVHCEMIRDPKAVPYLKQAAKWARDAGLGAIITGEGWKAESMSMEDAWEAARRAVQETVEECEKQGVHFALEPHGTFSLYPEGLKRIMDVSDSPYYVVNYDVGNLSHYTAADSSTFLPNFIARVGWVHIKDWKRSEDGKLHTVNIGTGDVNIVDNVKFLKQSGYTGMVSVEILGFDDPVGGSRHALGYLTKLIC